MAKRFRNPQDGRKLEGTDEVLKNLNSAIKRIKKRSMKGLLKATILIRRDMDKTPPLIPVDLGNLRASSFIVAGTGKVRSEGSFSGPYSAEFLADHSQAMASASARVSGKLMTGIGFSARYAKLVESDTTTRRQRPGSGGGFFEGALQRNAPFVIEVIKKEAKI
jgi:hypothetical protein